MMKTLLIGFSILLSIGCNQFKGTDKPITPTKSDEIKTEVAKNYGIVDSITVKFLSKATFEEATSICGAPLHEIDFILNEYGLIGLRKGLKNIFSEEELLQPILIKETKWNSKDDQYISVWYQQNGTQWKPIDIFKYNKSTQF